MKRWFILWCLISFILSSSIANKILITNINEKYELPKIKAYCMAQDYKGFLWFGMTNGLYKFDLNGFTNISSNKNRINSFPKSDIRAIVEYTPGLLLIGTYNKGLIGYNSITGRAFSIYINSPVNVSKLSINCLQVDKSGNIWIGTTDGLFKIKHLDNRYDSFRLINQFNKRTSELSNNDVIRLTESRTGKIWFLTTSNLGYFDSRSKKIKAFFTNSANSSFTFMDDKNILIGCYGAGLESFNTETSKFDRVQIKDYPSNAQTSWVFKDQHSNIWISADNVGLVLWNPSSREKTTIISNKNPEYSALNSNSINQIFESKDGAIWACNEDGINMICLKDNLFNSFSCDKSNFKTGIRSLLNSGKGFIWVGTMGAGLKQFYPATHTFVDVPLIAGGKSIKTIQSIMCDHKGNLWLGTQGEGIIKFTPDKSSGYRKGKLINYRLYPKAFPAKTLLNDFIMCLLEDRSNNIWVGTWAGLSLLESSEAEKPDQANAIIRNFSNNQSDNSSISNNTIMSLFEDKDGNIWAGTQEGLNKIIKTSKGFKFEHDFKDKEGVPLTDKGILSLYQTKNGNLWFSTQDGGISFLNLKTGIFKDFNSDNGFNDNIINSIAEDNSGAFWLGTNNGLCRFNPSGPSFRNYTTEDGLISDDFLFGSNCMVDSYMYFGSNKSLTAFNPKEFSQSAFKPNLTFTDLKIFNKTAGINTKGSPLKEDISVLKSITLDHNQNFITIAFAALNYNQLKEIQYSCKMEGLESSWNNLRNEHKITYTNLNPGHYTFKVKAYNSNAYNNASLITLKITIKPPFWKTIWAYLIYTILIFSVIFRTSLYFLNKEKRESALALERLNAKHTHELDLMRLRFFTNISHEFRTPLTLISAPLESLIKNKLDPAKTQSYYQIMLKNVQRLTRLINQLLDLRKIEEGYLKMEWNQGDIIDFIQKTYNTFQNYAEKRNIIFKFQSGLTELLTFFDADKLDKVLFNLLSNAFKYTSDFGSITLALEEKPSSETPLQIQGSSEQYLKIKISDTGFGIPAESMGKIFNPFQQANKNKPIGSAATGIGLSLTKELIEMHNGTILVDSEVNKGSCFTVYLPIYESNPQTQDNINETKLKEVSEVAGQPQKDEVKTSSAKNKPLILIVEDNSELRTFLSGEMQSSYHIIEAANGAEGFELAVQKIPDLIVSDIMMDKMDGIELCKKLKIDERTSHVPVILLTARHSEEIKLNSFEIGADDYITKPFNTNLLLSRIKNLIEQRRKLRSLFSKNNNMDFSTVATNKVDSRFLEKLTQNIEKNIGNPDFDPSILASNMAMSRMQLYRKVSALTNQTVYNLIRTIRLNKAAQLLITTDMQISEIAESVGYTEPSNFTKCFIRQFNQTPSQFVRTHHNNQDNLHE
ncbi:MAG: two-component regulator propeller domain-containing protein [Bacteroidota bacterium]|nr:two-component regulator propeller domain-containing protein [Bacteroidota bacterium]